jgi:acyl-CoA reductase-like NAD-dependent aldehyde dehydrogenase
MREIQNYINGKFQPPVNGSTIDDLNPATGEIIGTVPASTQMMFSKLLMQPMGLVQPGLP